MLNPARSDRKILKLLRSGGRLKNAELAGRVSVSTATCHRKTQRLIVDGFIFSFRAIVNPVNPELNF